MHYRAIAPGALATVSLLLAVQASAATYTPGGVDVGRGHERHARALGH
ncbi:hypothetical protein ABZ372_12205 [Streptomyces sp. NPDC005921]